ncbi:transmembrane protein 198-like isoform X2 [Lineus longissimus]|uniref:transmembrane protein 198-like isoform X2 n=1 Tax=Lineus longissimus TaxID=88925 RepID=UPI002B4EA4A8
MGNKESISGLHDQPDPYNYAPPHSFWNRSHPSNRLKDRCVNITYQYDVVPAVLCGMCFIFGILYTFFGYRFFKAVMFMTGFIFGSVVTYLICLEEKVLPPEGNAGVAIGAGILCGLITMLVQYVGLFLTGFHLGVLLALAGLVVMEQFYHPSTKWIAFGILFGIGVLFALMTLYFQKGCTIIGTSVFGAALMVSCLDYFVELFIMVDYLWDRIRVVRSKQYVCWFSWIIIGCWPFACAIGLFIQWRVTGKGYDHHEVLHARKRNKTVTVAPKPKKKKRSREKSTERPPRQTPLLQPQTPQPQPPATPPINPQEPHSRYRQLYRVRRFNGDVISQQYIKNIHDRLLGDIPPATRVQGVPR